MPLRLCRPLFALMAVILIAVTSVVSAANMAPTRDVTATQVVAALSETLTGATCGDLPSSDEHHCPFCRLLPEAERMGPVEVTLVLRPHDGWQQLSELIGRTRPRNINHPSRAPPFSA